MKVVASFITFGVLCILIPPVISTFLPGESLVEQQILEGADPTQILEQTAAGRPLEELLCDLNQVQFGKVKDGTLYIRQLNSQFLAAEVESQLKLFTIDSEGVAVVSELDQEDGNLKQLTLALQECKRNGEVPVSSEIKISLTSKNAVKD